MKLWRGLPESSELVANIGIERLKIRRQLDGNLASVSRRRDTIVQILSFGRFNERVFKKFVAHPGIGWA